MKPIPAIVEPADGGIAQCAAAVDLALRGYREAGRHVDDADRRANTARQVLAQMRLELGRALITARKHWPVSGPRAKGWGDFLKVRALDQDVALDAMKYAGYVDEKFPGIQPGNLPGRDADRDTKPSNPEADIAERIAKLDPDARGRIMRSLRSSVASERVGDRDSYCTPPAITQLLPEVDLDPCSNPRSTVRAKQTYSLEANQDGLVLPWFGLVYANVPFSDPLPWSLKFAAERSRIVGAGFMVNADHSPRWWRVLNGQDPEGPTKPLILRLDFDERIEFVAPPGVTPSKNDRPQTLLMDDAFWAACSQVELLKLGTLWRQTDFNP